MGLLEELRALRKQARISSEEERKAFLRIQQEWKDLDGRTRIEVRDIVNVNGDGVPTSWH